MQFGLGFGLQKSGLDGRGPSGPAYDPNNDALLSVWPNASNTGVPAGTGSLTPQTGDFTSTSDGQVIDKMTITDGTIIVAHNNVKVQRCKVVTTGSYGVFIQSGKTGAVVQDCDLSGAQTGIQGFGAFRRNNIYGVENGIVVSNGNGSRIRDNYIHDLFAAVDPHYDGIASQGGTSNNLIEHNWIYGPVGTSIQGIFVTTEQGVEDNVQILNNNIGNATYNVAIGTGVTNVSVQNNTFQEGTSGFYNFAATVTVGGNVSTRGLYIDGDVPPVVGTVAFQPSPNAVTAGSDSNINTGFRVSATMTQAPPSEFRVVFYTGAIAGMRLSSAVFGKQSAAQVATGVLQSILFGGSSAELLVAATQRYFVSDWMPRGALDSVNALIGFAMANPGGTGLASMCTNATSYFGSTGNVALADPSYSESAGGCFGLARIEVR